MPRVSVIVTTRGTVGRLNRALASVVANVDGATEVLVIDHGATSSVIPPESAPAVRHLVLDPCPLGEAWHVGMEAARGEFIAYCDELDRWQLGHLRALMRVLDAQPTVAVAYAAESWVDEHGGAIPAPVIDPWPDPAQPPFISASAMVHRVSAARRVGGFDKHLGAYADWDLCVRLSDWFALSEVRGVTVVREANPDRPELHPAMAEERPWLVRQLMARRIRRPLHRPRRSARHDQRQFDPATWTGESRELAVRSLLSGQHSYAAVNAGLLPALREQGVALFLTSSTGEIDPVFADFPTDDGTPRMTFFYETSRRPREVGVGPIAQYTMMEQAFLQQIHVEEINRYDALLFVPCRMNAEAFRAAGVTVPIQVLHHGIDPARFCFIERSAREVYTFGTLGQQNERKGIDVLTRAFHDEFRPTEPVRLILNATLSTYISTNDDPRIEIRDGFLSADAVIDYFAELDAFLLPSRGEGFGLCGLEAMATGLPTIATAWSGPAEYLDPADSFPLSYRLVETAGTPFSTLRLFGPWAEPSYEHLRHLMRWLYEHPAEGRAAGRRAAARVHRDWTWAWPARQIVAALNLLARGVSPPSMR